MIVQEPVVEFVFASPALMLAMLVGVHVHWVDVCPVISCVLPSL